jgi:predicted proteasome-type protease
MTGIQLIDYDVTVDVKRDASGLIVSGLIVGDILHQNQALILVMHKGDLKSDVSVGVGIDRMLLDNERLTWTREIREQLEMDGQKVDDVKITDRQIIIKAAY